MLNNTTLQREYFKTWMFKQGLSITLYDYLQDTLCAALEEGRYSVNIPTVIRTLTEEEFNSREFKLICDSLSIDTFYLDVDNNSIIFTFDSDIHFQNKLY